MRHPSIGDKGIEHPTRSKAVDVSKCNEVVEFTVSLYVRAWYSNQPSNKRTMIPLLSSPGFIYFSEILEAVATSSSNLIIISIKKM